MTLFSDGSMSTDTSRTLVTVHIFTQDTQVIVQLHNSNPGNSWSSTFDASSTKANDGVQFKATAVTP